MGDLRFSITHTEGKARTGILELNHGIVQTPAFIPVATRGYVKALTLEDLHELHPELLICNTYHLMLDPGADVVRKKGGLHGFMNWNGPIATDSGGFQVFSLGAALEHGTNKLLFEESHEDDDEQFVKKLSQKKKEISQVHVIEEGVYFTHNQQEYFLTPQKSIHLQEQLGADMILAFDECTCSIHDRIYTEKSLERTHKWALESLQAHATDQALIGIVQGGKWKDLREKSAQYIASLAFDGYAIGGSLGRTKNRMYDIIGWVNAILPEHKPRHLLGVGVVEDLFEAVERGIDLFDCVLPTRWGRFHYAYVKPPVGNKANKFRYKVNRITCFGKKESLDPLCGCNICKEYTQHDLYLLTCSDKKLASRLISYHNVYFFLDLMKEMRKAIEESRFQELKKEGEV